MSTPASHAVVDIGSNSIRLVLFGGPPRAPAVLYNEKVMAGLGRGVVEGGRLSPDSAAKALAGLARFAALIKAARPRSVRVVATAAVREAANGAEFLDRIRALGLRVELLSGEAEAVAAGYGVISALPSADGVVADLGGGSLELVRVCQGGVHQRVSLPFGAMRVAQIRAGGTGRLRKAVRKALTALDWAGEAAGRPMYLVGGSWRALARVQMQLTAWPLPVVANHIFPAADARELKAAVRLMGTAGLAQIKGVNNARVLQLDDTAALLAALAEEMGPAEFVVSGAGLREGLLYQALDRRSRALDPLIEAVRHSAGDQLHWPGADLALLAWSDPVFADEPPEDRRLRQAAFLIAGTGWVANPDFRVVAAEDFVLHGAWPGVTAADRAAMAMALHVGMGGDPGSPPALLLRLAPPERLARGVGWGQALRLAQRLGGGAPGVLALVPLALAPDGALVLRVPLAQTALIDGAAERRFTRLGLAVGRDTRIESLP